MSNALAIITDDIYASKDSFVSVLSDRSINFEREAGFAIQVIGSSEFMLGVAAGDRQAVINAVTNIAAIGISLNPAKKQAYLVPRNRKICLDISYMGLMDLAMSTGSIRWAQAELVCENDGFIRGRFDEPPTHTFNPFSKDRGPIVGVYVVVKTADGDYLTHTMEISAVMDIRDRSEAWKSYVAKKAKSCPWATDEGEMIKKTCVKQAYKYWPKTERLEKAIHYLNTDGHEGIDINKAPEKPADWIDVVPMIAEAMATKTDSAALKYWKDNNGRLVKQAKDHAKLKQAIQDHRYALKSNDEARTIEMPTVAPANDDFVAAMDAANNGYVPE